MLKPLAAAPRLRLELTATAVVAAAPMISAILSHSVVLVTMKESPQKAGQKTGREGETKTKTGKETKTKIGKKAETVTGKGKETKTVIDTETVTGKEVRDGKEEEIEMMMITTEVEIMTEGEIMIEIEMIDVVDTGLVLAQEPNLNIDQGHGLVHGPKAKELVALTWHLQLLQS